MQLEPFRKLPDSLMECNGFISKKDDSAVPLTATAKLVYVYMLSKGEFFVDKLTPNTLKPNQRLLRRSEQSINL